MDQLHTANKVCGGCCAISLNTVDTESSVSPKSMDVPVKLKVFLIVLLAIVITSSVTTDVLMMTIW